MAHILQVLLDYRTLAAAVAAFVLLLVVWAAKRNTLTGGTKAVFAGVLCLFVLYFGFLLWLTLAAGSNPPQPPTPTFPA